jgi:hypothetical protein
MARKFLLVPEVNYLNLLKKDEKAPEPMLRTSIGDDLDERGNFNFVKRKLRNVSARKTKNLSAKNVLYNQWLRSYLRLRKQLQDKPVKVEVSQLGPKLLINSGRAESTNAVKKALINEDGELDPLLSPPNRQPVKSEHDPESLVFRRALDFTTPSGRPKTQSSFKSKSSNTRENLEDVINPVNDVEEEEAPAPEDEVHLSRRQQQLAFKLDRKKADQAARAQKLYQLIMAQPHAFGVTQDKQIVNPKTNRVMAESDLMLSIRRLVDPSPKNPSPPGMRTLRAALMRVPETKALVEQIQSGRGRGNIILTKNLFKPSKWSKILRK